MSNSNDLSGTRKFFDVTTNDSVDLTNGVCRGFYVGAAGDVRVTGADMADGTYVTFTLMAAGVIHSIQAKRIWATGTDATGIIAVY